MIRLILNIICCVLLYSYSFAAEYHIGSGQEYTTIADFDWRSLQPGDVVKIHPGTHKNMIWLSRSGTEQSPIIIEGIPDSSGNLPVLDGDGMVIPSSYDGHLSEYDLGDGKLAQGYGMVFFHWSATEYYSEPNWITVKNFEIKNTTPESYTFTNSNGIVQPYPGSNAGVYVKTGNHIILENLVIHDVGNGIETQGVDEMVHALTIRGCHIYNFGRTDSRADREHGLYNEASGILVENNIIGPPRIGTSGSSIKDRGANTVIRYNKIYSTARALDLVEPENQGGASGCVFTSGPGPMYLEPGFDKSWVYGNIIINDITLGYTTSGNMIHYGGDNCPNLSRSGTLYFYNNTIYQNSSSYYTRTFDLTSPNETIELYNNVIVNTGTTTQYYIGNSSSTGYQTGTYYFLGGNWITSGYLGIYPGDGGTINQQSAILSGQNTGVVDMNYYPVDGSPLIGTAVPLPPSITDTHNVTKQISINGVITDRSDLSDIGAFDYTGASSTCSNGIQDGDETGIDCGGSCTACSTPTLLMPTLYRLSTGEPVGIKQ